MITLEEVEAELTRLKYGLTYTGLIINRTGQITNVLVYIRKRRIIFISDSTNSMISSYPAQIESIAKFLNAYWHANV